MKKHTVKIGGKEFALAFPLSAMLALEESVPGFDLGKIADFVKSPSGLVSLIAVMAAEGERLEGREPDYEDYDRAWFARHIAPAPAQVARLQIAILDTLSDWMRMETEEDDDAEHDVVLEEIKKKEEKGG